ncbi:MAG: hypothetical protein QXL82_02375 [Candidatus Aenigmatarchaeota archaeon]
MILFIAKLYKSAIINPMKNPATKLIRIIRNIAKKVPIKKKGDDVTIAKGIRNITVNIESIEYAMPFTKAKVI